MVTALPDSYRAAVIDGGTVEQIRLPLVPPGPGEALVKVSACALCTWEVRSYSGDRLSKPLLGGHELSGVVAAVGPAAIRTVDVGDRVAVRRLARCGGCRGCVENGQCRSSHLAVVDIETASGPQGLAEFVTVPAYQAVPVDPTLSLVEAALVEPVSCVVRSVDRARIELADQVLVLGAGFMGLLHARVARLRGARVLIADPRPDRRAAAEAEADHVIDPGSPEAAAWLAEHTDDGPAVVFVANSDAASVEYAVQVVADRGRVVAFASSHPARSASLSVNHVHHREIELLGAVAQSDRDFRVAAKLLSTGLLDVSPLISAVFPASRMVEAFDHAATGDGYRTVVEWESVDGR